MSAAVSFDRCDAFDPVQPRKGVDQPAARPRRQVDLRHVAGDDDFRAGAHPRQKHLHLRDGRVLGFVENDKRLVQRAASHVGQRNHLDQVLLGVALDQVVIHHFVQGIQQRPQIGIDLGLQIAGQKAEAFARLDRRPHQDDLADGLPFQGRHGHGHGQIGLSGSGGPAAQHDVVLANGLDVAAWPGVRGRICRPARKTSIGVVVVGGQAASHARQHAADVVGRHVALAIGTGLKLFEHLGRLADRRLRPLDVDLAVVHGNADAQCVADAPQVLIAGAEQRQQRLGTDDR